MVEKKTDSVATSQKKKTESEPSVTFKDFEELVAFLETNKYPLLVYKLKHDVSVKEFSDGQIKMTVSPSTQPEVIEELVKTLQETTGYSWKIDILNEALGKTLADKEEEVFAEQQKDVMEYPLVKAIMTEFKGAKIESIIRRNQEKESNGEETNNDLIFDEE